MQSTSRSSNVLRGSTPTCKHARGETNCAVLIDHESGREIFFFLFVGSTTCARCDTTGKKGHEGSRKSKPNFIKSLLLLIHGVEWCLSAIYHWVHKCTRWKATPIFISPIHPLSFCPRQPTNPPWTGCGCGWKLSISFHSSSLFYGIVQGLCLTYF